MAFSKIILNGTTQIDLTQDTVVADKLYQSYTAHGADGLPVVGTATGGGGANLQAKTNIDPTASSQTITADTGYDGLSSVQINAMPTGSLGTPSWYKSTAGTNFVVGHSYPDFTAGYIGSVSPLSTTLPMETKNVTPSETAQTIHPTSTDYYLSTVNVGAIASDYVGSGIPRRDYTDFVISGGTFTAPAGYYATDATDEIAYGTAGTPTATKGTVSNNAVTVTPSVTNTTGYITGGTKTGTGVIVRASELVSGTVYIDESGSWDVTNAATAVITEGTEGTPSATKGTVSNHSVSVTPSVTNTAGYISGGTKTGTAVTVSASELVSGSETKTANGTYDVTNLASLVVAVPIVTYYTGSSAPSSSLGSNGDIYLQTS